MAIQHGNKVGIARLGHDYERFNKKPEAPETFQWADEKDPILAQEVAEYAATANRDVPLGSQAVDTYWEWHERNNASVSQYRLYMQDEFKLRREGRILHMNDFLRMLRSCGLRAVYGDKGGMPKTLPLAIFHEGYNPETCGHTSQWAPHYVCFVQVPLMQEYEEIFIDEHNLPAGIKRRGWRTVLLRLIDKGLLTEEKAHEVFGRPAESPISRRYLATLKEFRAAKLGGTPEVQSDVNTLAVLAAKEKHNVRSKRQSGKSRK